MKSGNGSQLPPKRYLKYMDVLLINDILKIPTTGFSDYEKSTKDMDTIIQLSNSRQPTHFYRYRITVAGIKKGNNKI